jgi:riboflavin kinase/FMN adenylyltransferase
MKVLYDIGKIDRSLKGAVVAIGVFDGLHIGHQKVIKTAVRKAKRIKAPCVVMTFFPHPVSVLCPGRYLPYIVSLPHRLKLIEQLGATACLVVNFTKKFSRLTALQFIEKYLSRPFHPKEICVGADFCFGRDREGGTAFFKEAGCRYGFKVNAVSSVKAGGKKVGSSLIRRMIMRGRLKDAAHFLGRPVSIMGKVVKGNGRGRTLGFPTANILPENDLILPVGVYAVRVLVGKKRLSGMANVGRRPSFKKDKNDINVEAHIFGFKKSLYGKQITVEFIKKIRSEKTFDSPKKLAAQLARDALRAETILRV